MYRKYAWWFSLSWGLSTAFRGFSKADLSWHLLQCSGSGHLRNVSHSQWAAWPVGRGVLDTLGLSLILVLCCHGCVAAQLFCGLQQLWGGPCTFCCICSSNFHEHQCTTSLKIEQEVIISAVFFFSFTKNKVVCIHVDLSNTVYVLYIFQGQTCIHNTGSNLQKWKREKVRSFISMETSICNICLCHTHRQMCVCFGWKFLTYLMEKKCSGD